MSSSTSSASSQGTVTLTALLYSGRVNPKHQLTVEQSQQLSGHVQQVNFATSATSIKPEYVSLGYTGLLVEAAGVNHLPAKIHVYHKEVKLGDGIVYHDDGATHALLLSFFPSASAEGISELAFHETRVPSGLTHEERKFIQSSEAPLAASSISKVSLFAVPFNPAKWNHEPVQSNNNCYNYANDQITNTFAQPGRGTGKVGPFPPNCGGTGDAAVRDGLQRLHSWPQPIPKQGQNVALVIASTPFQDYHWYRQDINGMWSHKPGSTPCTNLDNSGHPISDPSKCDRGYYTTFCGYFLAYNAKIR